MSSRLRRVSGVLSCALVFLVPLSAAAAWRAGNLFGGGYNDVVRFHPTDANRVLLATDVGGIHLSTDGGSTWGTRGRYVNDYVASLLWHPTLPNVAYGLAGKGRPGSGGLMVSTDSGATWRLDSSVPTGHSNNTPDEDGLPKPHPRSIGQLLVADTVNGFLYAGTYEQGLMRAPLGAAGEPGAWTTIALAPVSGAPFFIRGIDIDDVDPTKLYVATSDSSVGQGVGRVYRVSNATGSATTVELTASPRHAEEVRVVAGHLYAVANDAGGKGVGVFRLANARSAAAGASWRRIAAGPSVTSVTYYGLEVVKRGTTTTMWVSSDNAWRPNTSVAHKYLWRGRSADDFATDGTWATFPNLLTDTPNDTAGPNATPVPWWMLQGGGTYAWPGKDPGYTAGDIAVSPANVSTVIVAGQGSPWRTRDDGNTWYPVPTGINLLVQERITADLKTAGRAFIGNVDYRAFGTNDAFRTHTRFPFKEAGIPSESNDGWSVAIDSAATGARAVYFGLGTRDTNNGGQIWMDADPSTPGNALTQVLAGNEAVLGTEAGNRPIGLAVIRNPAAPGVPIVLAVMQAGHMYRKAGTGAWTRVASFTSPIVGGDWPQAVSFAWRPGFTNVYCYDRATGLWRSKDFGQTWVKLYASPNTSANRQGFVAAHPTSDDLVYLSTSAAVSVVTNAGSAGAGGAVLGTLGFPAGKPGALDVGADGRIYATTFPAGGAPSRVYANKLNAAGTGVLYAWQDVSDDTWRNALDGGRELAIGADGTVYVATGGGVFILDGGATLP